MSREPRILVLDGHQRASLAAVRSLGRQGLHVTVGEVADQSLAGASRFCSERIRYADPFLSPRAFFDDVLSAIHQLGITFVLPITEATSYVLLRYRSELPHTTILPFPDAKAVEQLADKNELFRLAMANGVPVPASVFCDSIESGLQALEQVEQFPVVLKPSKSKILMDDRIIPTQVIIARNKAEAIEALSHHDYFRFPFTVQAFIEGTGKGVFALFDHGKPVCYFAHRRLREKPPGGGVSVLSESAAVDQTLQAHADCLLRKANWHGVAMVEFRVAPGGTGYLMEVNPRFWGSLQLAIDAGMDFPWWLYQVSTNQPVAVEHQWRPTRLRWLLGDLDRLYLVLKAPVAVYPLPAKLREIVRFLLPSRHTRHEVNRWSDLRPFWFELKRYVRLTK